MNRGLNSFILSDTSKKKKDIYPAMCLAYSCISLVHAVLVTREISSSKVIEYQRWTLLTLNCFRGSLHDTGTSSLGFPLMALYLFTWYHYKMSCWHESLQSAFNPVMLYWRENFIQGWNMCVNAKHATTHFGVKSVCRWTGMGSACEMIAILNHTCILSTWSVSSNNWD